MGKETWRDETIVVENNILKTSSSDDCSKELTRVEQKWVNDLWDSLLIISLNRLFGLYFKGKNSGLSMVWKQEANNCEASWVNFYNYR